MGDKTETQFTDSNEALVCPAEKPQLVDMKAWEDATKLIQEKNVCEKEKSEGKRPSNTLELLPKFDFGDEILGVLRAMPPGDLKEVLEIYEAQSTAPAEQRTEYSNGVQTTRIEGKTLADGTEKRVDELPTIQVDLAKVQPQPVRPELDKDGKLTGTMLDAKNRPVCKTNEDGSVSVYERDSDGRLTMTTTEYPDGVSIRTGAPKTEMRNGIPIKMDNARVVAPGDWIHKDDGSYVNPAGDKITTNDDGSVSMTTRDGTYTQRPDGQRSYAPIVTKYEDGVQVTQTRGLKSTRIPDGSEIDKYDDGTVSIKTRDGIKAESSSDGTRTLTGSDGNKITVNPDDTFDPPNSQVEKLDNGTILIRGKDGSRVFFFDDGRINVGRQDHDGIEHRPDGGWNEWEDGGMPGRYRSR